MDSAGLAVRGLSSERGRSDCRPASTIGRQARLELTFESRRGRTVLSEAYAESPFRVGRTSSVGDAAYLIIVCAGPGIFGGDSLKLRVTVGPGAKVLLASQSALQVHPGLLEEQATMRHEYRVAEGAELHCHWDPVIPFARSRLVERFYLDIARDGRLYWHDTLMSGRSCRGEAWRFDELDHELRLTVDGRLAYLDRYRIENAGGEVTHPWVMAQNHYLSVTLARHEGMSEETAERVQSCLTAVARVRVGFDLLEPSLLVGRTLAETGVGAATVRAACQQLLSEEVFTELPLAVRR